jgi:hypothetical protein
MNAAPIFVHSLFRSGSTYLFEVFRRSPAGYWCYQEPLNEHLRHAADAPDRLLEISSRDSSLLRHPTLDKPYFWEFYQVRGAIAPLFRKELSYDGFFATPDSSSFRNLVSYLRGLIDSAQGRPFFQCCRTTGRSGALREALAGTHIHLWRNPHDQWWSYQVGDYFNATTQRIFNAADLPPPLVAVKASCGIADFHDDDIEKELAHDRNHRLAAREDYVSFYALWLYSMLVCERTADLSLNIDALTTSAAYRQRVLDTLTRIGIRDLDFSDSSIARAPFGAAELAFFAETEDQVHRIFLDHDIRSDDLAAALELRTRHAGAPPTKFADAAAASSRLRDVAARQMNALAKTQRDLIDASRIAEMRQIDLEAAQSARDTLASELAEAHSRVANLASDLAEMSARLDGKEVELASARQRLERLNDELRAAGLRLAEAQFETHRWWAVADDTRHHLHAIYASRSWRLTAPLREINAWRKRLAGRADVGVAALDNMPRRAVQRLLLAAWAHVRGHPERRARFVRLLAPFPKLYAHLRAFAFAHAPAVAPSIASSESLAAAENVRWNEYPKSVQQVHAQLMRARAATARAPGQAQPGQTPR